MSARLLLFDIDGTLVLTGGAGKRAITRAFRDLFDVADAFAGVSLNGRTDRYLVEQGLERHGLAADAGTLTRVRDRYIAYLAEEMHAPAVGLRAALPGVAELLDAIDARPHAHAALLTGNYASGARIKLEYFDLWRRFTWGAFGDDHAERDHIARAAVAAAPSQGVTLRDPSQAVVIGDTPFDVSCARAAGARVIAVATGGHSLAELRACEPDAVFEDLSDIAAVLAAMDV